LEEDLKIMGIGNLRLNMQDWEQWEASVEEAKVHDGL
jgi:hypothetical protein